MSPQMVTVDPNTKYPKSVFNPSNGKERVIFGFEEHWQVKNAGWLDERPELVEQSREVRKVTR